MKRETKLVAVATAAAILAGCASGGGGTRRTEGDGLDELARGFVCVYSLGLACPKAPDPEPTYTYSGPLPLTRWQDSRGKGEVSVGGPVMEVKFERTVDGAIVKAEQIVDGNAYVHLSYLESGSLSQFSYGSYDTLVPSLNGSTIAARPWVEVLWSESTSNKQARFTDAPTEGVGVFANPYALGWDYQTFGTWNHTLYNTDTMGAESFGAPTPGLAVPGTGTATFTGKLIGMYAPATGPGSLATADLSVHADFARRSLTVSSSGTTLTRDLSTITPAPQLNLNGTLSYEAGSSSFSGTLVNAAGTMSGASKGKFYGPKAEELGGVFVVKSPSTVETFTGAYGAKR